METQSHILGAFDTLAGAGAVREDRFLEELRARGFSDEDARRALERAFLEGWLGRALGGTLIKRIDLSPKDRWEAGPKNPA